ncbi:dihydroxyacetone kinase subunit DhaK [Streptomyces sp. NPDC058086]|uniref:dihydroxyacetone kinase subunit DhaK n=1 Tax=Streptomyces sp. NPDC058086 TaxID=3346334 RepID=UPI0036E4A189
MKVPRPRATVAACAAATAVALAVGAALPAGAVGYTASAGPWGPAVSLTGADGQQSLIDVQVAGDGTAFALWRNKAAGATTWDIQAVVKPVGSDKWAAPHTLWRSYVGEYCTSLDMAGVSITLVRLDDEISDLLADPAEIPIRVL